MMSTGSLASDAWKACAVPWKFARRLAGTPRSPSTLWIAVTASPSDLPGARLNEIVIAGNCPWWLIDREVVDDPSFVKALSGTSWLGGTEPVEALLDWVLMARGCAPIDTWLVSAVAALVRPDEPRSSVVPGLEIPTWLPMPGRADDGARHVGGHRPARRGGDDRRRRHTRLSRSGVRRHRTATHRADGPRRRTAERRPGHRRLARLDVERVDGVRVLQELRLHFEDDVVRVDLGEARSRRTAGRTRRRACRRRPAA